MWIDTLTHLPHLLASAAPVADAVAGAANQAVNTGTGVDSPYWFMPYDASASGDDVDWTMWMINYVSFFFGGGVILLLILFVLRFRHRAGSPEEGRGALHSTTLEITWTMIPTLIVLVIFTFGFSGFLSSQVAPEGAVQVMANGKKWVWFFSYPDALGEGSPELWVPVGEPVMITLESSDVIHSLYIPAFRVKKDVVPGRYNKLWFEADKEGTYDVFCAEYCGQLHSQMITKVHVVSREVYDAKMLEISNPFNGRTVVEVGEKIYNENGCITCHSIDGSAGTGPTWKNLWMTQRQFNDGTSAVADEAYISESIKYPGRKIVTPYAAGQMPSYAAQLDDRKINAVIEYIKTLSDDYVAPETPEGVEEGAAEPVAE